ncbi:hypothetical protein KDK77_00940 [bacterium]|nr:hypothetical protein [bacterium]MCP5462038.1 hypothetical protein [bacterium]
MKKTAVSVLFLVFLCASFVRAQEIIEIQRADNVATVERDFSYYFSPYNYQRQIVDGGYVTVGRDVGTSRAYSFTWTYFSSTTYYRISEDRAVNAIANFAIPANFDAQNLNYVKLHVIAGAPLIGENNNNHGGELTMGPEPHYFFERIPSSYTNGTFHMHVAPIAPEYLDLTYNSVHIGSSPSTLVDDFNGNIGEKVVKKNAPVTPDSQIENDGRFQTEYVIDVTEWYLAIQGGGGNFIGFAFFMIQPDGTKGYTAVNIWSNIIGFEPPTYDAFSPYLEFSFNEGPEAVPEPLSVILLGVALSFLGGYGRYKKK